MDNQLKLQLCTIVRHMKVDSQMGKFQKKIFNNRALSPIFATVLLVAIVVVVGSIAYYFSTNLTTNAANQYTSTLSTSQQAISERLGYENVVYSQSSQCNLTVYLINCGAANNVKIDSIFIYDQNHTIVGTPYTPGAQISPIYQIDSSPPTLIPNNSLNVGVEGYFVINLSGPLTHGAIYDIHLITKEGSSFDYNFMV